MKQPHAHSHGRMTRAMRAVRPFVPHSDVEGLVLRVATVIDGTVVDESTFDGSVVVGVAVDCNVVLDDERAPDRHELFVKDSTGYRLNPWAGITGRTSNADTITAGSLALGDRGMIRIGAQRLLFHVHRKPLPAAPLRLPKGIEQGFGGSIDWFTTTVAAFSFLIHFFGVGLVYSDWMDPVVDDHAVIAQLVETSKRTYVPPPIDQPAAAATEAATAEARTTATKRTGPLATSPAGRSANGTEGATRGPKADARAAELGAALDALGLQTLTALERNGLAMTEVLDGSDVPFTALDEAGRSRDGVDDGNGLRLDGNQADNFVPAPRCGPTCARVGPASAVAEANHEKEGEVKTVKGPDGGASAGGGDVSKGGKNIPGASGVVARMRGRFRGCYRAGLANDPTLEGTTSLVASVGANGSVTSVGGGGGKLAPIVPCLKAVVRGAQFSAPKNGSGTVAITVNFWRIQ